MFRCLRRRSLCCSSSSSRVLCLAKLFGMKHKDMVRLCPAWGACSSDARQERRLKHPWATAKGLMEVAFPSCCTGLEERDANTSQVPQSTLAPPS